MFAVLDTCTELRPLLPQHAARLATCVDTYREHLTLWTILASQVVDEASARQLLEHYAEPPRYFGIWNYGVLSGGAVYRALDTRAGVCEIGGWLTPPAEGRGLITRAFQEMIRWATDIYGSRRFELHASPHNIRARSVAQRLGMTHETTLRKAFTLNGTDHDSEVWVFTGQQNGTVS